MESSTLQGIVEDTTGTHFYRPDIVSYVLPPWWPEHKTGPAPCLSGPPTAASCQPEVVQIEPEVEESEPEVAEIKQEVRESETEVAESLRK